MYFCSRCIPAACVDVYDEHKNNDTGVCRCEFTECSEYVFNSIDDQCPDWAGGPICGMSSYLDDFDSIGILFDGAPEVRIKKSCRVYLVENYIFPLFSLLQTVPTESELAELGAMQDDLDGVISFLDEFANDNPLSTRKKRSSGIIFCADLKKYIDLITQFLELGSSSMVFPSSR